MSQTHDGDAEGRLDLVPMIDTVMLLLLFFMLTTKFKPDEMMISSLLPTNGGPVIGPPVVEKKLVQVCVYPAGMEWGNQPSAYLAQHRAMLATGMGVADAFLRIGNGVPIRIDGKDMESRDPQALATLVARIGTYVSQQMETYEDGTQSERTKQPPIIIHCFSGMPWRFGLIAYDAVRYYEAQKQPGFHYTGKPEELKLMREVTFASPRIRKYTDRELGEELFDIIGPKR
ncbi:MAG: biopolymer transporter ExbD [Planctomycetota bacterium]